jgi:flagellar basal-body rod protein FlgB
MSKVFFEDAGMRFMERSLDLAVERQALISSNLANVDTPGYKTVDIDFEHQLKQATEEAPALHVTNARHIALGSDSTGGSPAQAEEIDGLPVRNDLNNVNVDREMAQLSMNALRFSMMSQLLAGKFHTLKNAIAEGK